MKHRSESEQIIRFVGWSPPISKGSEVPCGTNEWGSPLMSCDRGENPLDEPNNCSRK